MNRTLPGVLVAIAALLAASALTGCPPEKKAPAAGPDAAAADPAAAAQQKFDTLCAACHGKSGKGDGAAAAALDPKPRNYTDAAWQDSVTDADLSKIIVEGGGAVGKSATMPANPDLKDKPDVVKELVKIIRSFKGK